jgi:hypothetical protein
MNIHDKRRTSQLDQRRDKFKLIQQFKGALKPMKDATGRELKRGQIVHVPITAIPQPVLVCEIAEVIEAGVIKVPGAPPLPPRIVLSAMIMQGPSAPDGVFPYLYVVGEKVRKEVPVEEVEPPKVIEGLEPENPLDTNTTAPPLESEKPPEGMEDILLTDKDS